jgi:hypothetical protein
MTNTNKSVILYSAFITLCCVSLVCQAYSYFHRTKTKSRTEKVAVNEERLAIEICTPLVPDQLAHPNQVTIVGKPEAHLVDLTWLVTGYVDVPNPMGALYRRQWACGVIISSSGSVAQHKVQFVTVDQRESSASQHLEKE